MTEGEKTEAKASAKRSRLWQAMVVIVIFALGSVVLNFVLSRREAERQNQKICGVITVLNQAYHSGPPPTTALGRQLALAIDDYSKKLNCPIRVPSS